MSVALEKECHWGGLSEAHARPTFVSLFLLPMDQDVNAQLLLQHHAGMLSTMMIWTNSKTVGKPSIKCFLLYVAMAMVSPHSNRAVTKTQPHSFFIP